MVIIFGFGKKRHPVGGFRMMCNNCGGPSVQVGMITKSSFTLFWVPFVPLGSAKELICARCKTVTTASTFPWKEEVTPEKFQEELVRSNQMLATHMTMRQVPMYPPPGMPLETWQAALRRQFGREQSFALENLGVDPVFSDFRVTNPANNTSYRVAIRGAGLGDNFCSCPDFATNTLGTCKHIEFSLARLERKRGGKAALRRGFHHECSSRRRPCPSAPATHRRRGQSASRRDCAPNERPD